MSVFVQSLTLTLPEAEVIFAFANEDPERANEDPERCFFINDTGGYDYEVLGKGRLLGSIQPWFRRPWTYSQTFTVKCFLHASKCKHILAVKGRSKKSCLTF